MSPALTPLLRFTSTQSFQPEKRYSETLNLLVPTVQVPPVSTRMEFWRGTAAWRPHRLPVAIIEVLVLAGVHDVACRRTSVREHTTGVRDGHLVLREARQIGRGRTSTAAGNSCRRQRPCPTRSARGGCRTVIAPAVTCLPLGRRRRDTVSRFSAS